MNNNEELLVASREIGITSYLLSEDAGAAYVHSVLNKFKPQKISGHLSIYNESVTIPLEGHEFTYSTNLNIEPVYVFFEQVGRDVNKVVVIEQGNKLGEVLENSYGMEYFVSNKQEDYLLAVNWYVIEGAGSAISWMEKLK